MNDRIRDAISSIAAARRPLLVLFVLAAGAVGAVVACDETGPSPIGEHPDDSGTPAAEPDAAGDQDGEADAEPEGDADAPDAEDAAVEEDAADPADAAADG